MNRKPIRIIAILVMVIFSMSCAILAQEQSLPENETTDIKFIFVQTAKSGSFTPMAGNDSLYVLNLKGVSLQTIAFSDRPERIVGQVPMQKFLDQIDFTANPPNAAIDILEANDDEDVVVVELLDPIYDDYNQTLQYTVSILEQANHSYAEFNERNDKTMPETFGAVALFIDGSAEDYPYEPLGHWDWR
jgi:hypothetical protein